MRRGLITTVVVIAALGIVCALPASQVFASKSSPNAPTLSVTSAPGDTGGSGSTSVPLGDSVHIAAGNLNPAEQAVIYKGWWNPTPQFPGWAYVYYYGLWPDASGTVTYDEVQDTAGTFRYQVCQSATSHGKTVNVCSPYVQIVVS